jgi:quinol monooxygenase YgiN
MAYVVSAVWTAKLGKEELVRDVIRELTPLSRAEPGCRFYMPYFDSEEPGVFRLFEIYDDEEAYKAHAESEHFQRLALGRAIPELETRERGFYETFE